MTPEIPPLPHHLPQIPSPLRAASSANSAASANPATFDPGLTQKYTGAWLRTINKDGSFNIRRKGVRHWAGDFYTHLVAVSWPAFLAAVVGIYMLVNLTFAGLYVLLGPHALRVTDTGLGLSDFAQAFFFSVHTLTTVGYGDMYPLGIWPNTVAAIEAATGLMGFALATGLLYGRFSRPKARLIFSERALISPYPNSAPDPENGGRDGMSLQFRVANRRSNVLMEVSADVMLMTVVRGEDGQLKRQFVELKLERPGIFFLALTWTVVHPIDASSPLWGKTDADLEALQAEVLILLRSFDDSFSQVVHSRHSYVWNELEWSARFAPAFDVSKEGHMVLDIDRISHTLTPEASAGLSTKPSPKVQ